MKDLNYGKGYKYSPNHDYKEEQEYLPEKLRGKKYLAGNAKIKNQNAK
jgi:putative ATPase